MVKKVYTETVKKWATGTGISGVSLVGLIFMYLFAIGSITSVSYSGDVACAGTELDPCYAYINFTAEEDIFLYPTGYDPWGRETIFAFDPSVKSWKFERSWGTGWREINLSTNCKATWCGAPDNKGTTTYSVAFREDRTYQTRITAYKNKPSDSIKWGAFTGVDNIDPIWLPEEKATKEYSDIMKIDSSDFIKEKFNPEYGAIKLKDIERKDIIEYSLIKNTEQCTTDCETFGRATLYKRGLLFDGIEFIDGLGNQVEIKDSTYWIGINEIYFEEVPDKYEEVCNKINCTNVVSSYKNETRTRLIWEEYNYQELDAGDYEWKLTGEKDSAANVDFRIKSNGVLLSEWAWWNGTGGTVTYDGDYTIHTFTTNGTFSWTDADYTNASVLIIAGGGSGGVPHGGGGGAGGVIYQTGQTITAGSYPVVVGAGGAGTIRYVRAGDGFNSSFNGFSALGGGSGGVDKVGFTLQNGLTGGSGGGGSYSQDGQGTGGAGLAGQGYAGGIGNTGQWGGAGGGGASAVGQNGGTNGGNGGAGVSYSISGSSVCYAGGGGGGTDQPTTSATCGGTGGINSANTADATDGTGGGSGGVRTGDWLSGDGGDGVVIIRYLTPPPLVNCTFSGYVKDSAGAAIENANITIWNQFKVSEFYETNSSATGYWDYNITNSTNTYMVGAYINNTLIGQLKTFILGTC